MERKKARYAENLENKVVGLHKEVEEKIVKVEVSGGE